MGKVIAFLSGAAAGVLGYMFVKSDLGKECITTIADKCRPLTEDGKEWVDTTLKKVTDRFPSGSEETTFSYTYTSGSEEDVEAEE